MRAEWRQRHFFAFGAGTGRIDGIAGEEPRVLEPLDGAVETSLGQFPPSGGGNTIGNITGVNIDFL